jgi:hypothetical protein
MDNAQGGDMRVYLGICCGFRVQAGFECTTGGAVLDQMEGNDLLQHN